MAKQAHQQVPEPTSLGDVATRGFVERLGGGQPDFIEAKMSGDQASTWPADTVVLFDTALRSRGITVNGSGRFSGLKAGRTYFLIGNVAITDGSTRIPWKWYNVTNATALGGSGTSFSPSMTSASGYVTPTTAIICPTSDIEVEFRAAAAPSAAGTWTAQANNGWSEHNSSAIIMELSAMGGGGALEFVDRIRVTGSAVQSVSFGAGGDGELGTALDGDVDEHYVLVANIVHAGAPSTGEFTIRPNATTTLLSGQKLTCNGATPGGQDIASSWPIGNFTSEEFGVTAEIFAKSGGIIRRGTASGVAGYTASGDPTIHLYGGTWDDVATKITSLQVYATTGVHIGIGTEFTLYRRTRFGPVLPEYAFAKLTADQTYSDGGAIDFDTMLNSRGISVDANGRFSLKAGRVYELEASCKITHSSTAQIEGQWYDVTGAAFIGIRGVWRTTTAASNNGSQAIAKAILAPSVDSEVEVRMLTAGTASSQLTADSSWAMIKEIR